MGREREERGTTPPALLPIHARKHALGAVVERMRELTAFFDRDARKPDDADR